MNKLKKYGVLLLSCLTLATAPATVLPSNTLIAEAHSGRTDANGGHHDYKNKSGLGSYHYHCGGHPAHLHPNGVCPYASNSQSSSSSSTAKSTSANTGTTITYDLMTSYSKVFDADFTIRHIRISRPRSGAIPSTSSHIFTLPECPKAGKDAQILMSTCTKKTIPISRQRLEAI